MSSLIHEKGENLFLRMFPPPSYLSMPSVGVDISDHSVRVVDLKRKRGRLSMERFGRKAIPDGTLSYGDIKNRQVLEDVLKELKSEQKLSFVRCSLPEEKTYLFKTTVPAALKHKEVRENINFQLEENVPIKASDAVFDYVFLKNPNNSSKEVDVVVSVFPKQLVESYLDLYRSAGLTPLSFEMEANSIARALIPRGDQNCYMIVDFGQQRTGLSIVDKEVVQFTSTVEVGGNILTAAIQKQFNISFEEAEKIKQEETFVVHGAHREFFSSLMNSVSALSDEINKHYIYWHLHKDRKGDDNSPIQKIIFCGGDANLGGFIEHLSLSLKTRVELGNVWSNILSLEEEVPEMSFATSLSYATAIGLAIRTLN